MAEKSKVTRIKAKDDTPKEAKVVSKTTKAARGKKETIKAKPVKRKASKVPRAVRKAKKAEKPLSKHWYIRMFQKMGRYFTGSWHELKQVRWPTRGATWSLTVAVIIFSGFFVAIIMGLDYVFNALFEFIISN